MATYTQRLSEWAEREVRTNGLIDVKFFPPDPGSTATVEDAAREAYVFLSGQRESVEVKDLDAWNCPEELRSTFETVA